MILDMSELVCLKLKKKKSKKFKMTGNYVILNMLEHVSHMDKIHKK